MNAATAALELPPGYRVAQGGEAEQLAESGQSALVALVLAAGVSWIVAGQILAPVNTVRKAAARLTEADLTRLGYLQQHNDVLTLHIADPLESTLSTTAANASWVVGDGQYQLNISPHQIPVLDQGLARQQQLKKDQLLRLMALKGLPLITLDTGGHQLARLITALGRDH